MKVQKVNNAIMTMTWNEFELIRKVLNAALDNRDITLTDKDADRLKSLSSNMNKAT